MRTLWFVESLITDGEHVIDIKELQTTSPTPLHTLSSFPIPLQDVYFSFSLVLLHASFTSWTEVVVLDVQNSKTLLRAQVVHNDISPGEFSPNGCFFACKISEEEICVWQNAPTGYLPWRSLRIRFPCSSLLFSPTTAQILCCYEGIQILSLDNNTSLPSPARVGPCCSYWQHLVAYFPDWVHIAMAQRCGSVVTVFNHLLGTSQQFNNSDMEIQDIKVVACTLFVVDRHKLVSWDLEAGGTSGIFNGARRVVINDTLAIDPDARHLTLSHNCSQLAFTRDRKAFLYNLTAPGPITIYTSDTILGLQFPADQHKLWLHTSTKTLRDGYSTAWTISYWFVELQIMEGRGFGDVTTSSPLGPHKWAHLSSDECSINSHLDCWVEDSGGKKLLWLPPSWRAGNKHNIKWNSNFLALVDGHHSEPIIIQFHP